MSSMLVQKNSFELYAKYIGVYENLVSKIRQKDFVQILLSNLREHYHLKRT